MNNTFFRFCFYIMILISFSKCSSSPGIRNEMAMIQPVLDTESQKIIESIPGGSPITVWWCFDDRFESGTVSVISDWVQRSFEEMLVNSKIFKVVTRIHLEKIFEEQRFQMTGHVDDNTIAEIGRILGAKYMIVSTITRYGTLEIQNLNSQTGEIVYVSNKPIQRTR